jgi:L-ribulose-5-phosphate 3-epimerase
MKHRVHTRGATVATEQFSIQRISSMPNTPTIAFNTANLVARVTDWKFELSHWGEQDKLTVERTDEREWAAICTEIATAGFRAVEIWVAHVHPSKLTDARAKAFRKILDDNGLEPIGLAGTLNDDTARVCSQLGIPCCNGGFWGSDLETVRRLVRETSLRFNYENHPEKSADEIRSKIDGGSDRIGVALDTGWLGTHHLDGPAAVAALGALVRHVHLKDVTTLGGHDTCPLGQGVVDIAGVIKALKAGGYSGVLSWEDEPENRNPMLIAEQMREWIETTWNAA